MLARAGMRFVPEHRVANPMLPVELTLELRSRPAARRPGRRAAAAPKPPLLFVHGGYCDAWCWEPHFLPWFASLGYASHALSLRGHGESGGHPSLFLAGLDDYAADVERVAAMLPDAPILIGHSLGAAVVERLLATGPVRAAALMAPIPPTGLMTMAARLATERPDYMMQMRDLDPARMSAQVLRTLQPFYFSDDVEPSVLAEFAHHIGAESTRALFDLSLRLHWQLPQKSGVPVLVMGAEKDRICTPDDVHATAKHHGVEPLLLSGLAHMMMLERGWETSAQGLADWLETVT